MVESKGGCCVEGSFQRLHCIKKTSGIALLLAVTGEERAKWCN